MEFALLSWAVAMAWQWKQLLFPVKPKVVEIRSNIEPKDIVGYPGYL